MLAGVATAMPALNPPHLTGGYKSTRSSQKNSRKSFGYKGFTKFKGMSNELQ
ncbi:MULTISPECIES: conjugal transfer protein [Lactobacillales]|uniref:conjugal transfer protein n=1 Tax=Lacticaseibacillus paracasei TaxID=1597 RepID=UPI000B83A2EE|nr:MULTISPECIES: conjugal transfer protein [Lactobacillales]EAF8634447.1 conjugal transfer protein [Listeria monocytogenes]EAF9011349.1 conjugal transfer protein [Listeria monocytogenes]EAF9053399.1 conjugal transfer protein [Listeria monocytogenes]EAF9078058.1 conjugal transfer protein [Listeria monocytogenes]EAG3558518.1 conjugal transfer protein [Listeria monocytogenes]